MAKPIAITGEWTAPELRRLAAASRHANQSRRLLSLAAVLDGMNVRIRRGPPCAEAPDDAVLLIRQYCRQ